MAILTATELNRMQRRCESTMPVTYTKPQINPVVQAVEDWFEANRASLNTALTAAATTAGITLTAAQKKAIVAFYLELKFEKER